MSTPYTLCAVVAMSPQRIIGKDGRMPWHLPEDLKLFKELTLGHPILMGRKTFESIGRSLPGRQNIVLTRQADWQAEGVTVIHDIAELSELELQDREVMLIGGGELYRLLLERCDILLISRLHHDYEGDTSFPAFEHLFNDGEMLREYADFSLFCYTRRTDKEIENAPFPHRIN